MSWKCRMFRKEISGHDPVYMICEAFFDKAGMWGWSEEPESMEAESTTELIEYLEMALRDIKNDGYAIFDHETGEEIELAPQPTEEAVMEKLKSSMCLVSNWEDAEQRFGEFSDEHLEVQCEDLAWCVLPEGHDGPHQFSANIVVSRLEPPSRREG